MKTSIGDVHIELDTSKIEGNLKEAQKLLNMQIVKDCEQYVPFQQGALRGSVTYPQGIYGGEIEWNTPYAHYQYEGIVYGPNLPQYDEAGNLTGWRSPPVKYKTSRKLTYHTAGTSDHWFEKAKQAHLNDWVELVKKTVGG